MRVIVTGTTGFIGRHVLPLLIDQGWEVFAVTRKSHGHQVTGVHWIEGDILGINTDQALQEKIRHAQATHLLHLAWFTKHGEFWNSEDNFRWVEASMGLLRAFHQGGGGKVVIAGTCAEYDWSYGYCREEVTPCRPASIYGICKHALHLMARAWCEHVGMELCWGRVFFPYGPGESKSRLIPYLVRSFRKGDVPICRNNGAFRDLIHVEDVARGFLVLLIKGCKGAYNICSGVPVRICEVVQEIAKLFGIDELELSETHIADGEPPLLTGDNARLLALGWKPEVTLADGLKDYVEEEK